MPRRSSNREHLSFVSARKASRSNENRLLDHDGSSLLSLAERADRAMETKIKENTWRKISEKNVRHDVSCGLCSCSECAHRNEILEELSVTQLNVSHNSAVLCSRVPSSSSVASCSMCLRSLWRVCLRWYFAWHNSQSVLFPAALADNVYSLGRIDETTVIDDNRPISNETREIRTYVQS